jgi:phage baseplate assembly protein V
MQTADVRLLHDEVLAGAERFQDYGFTSVPKPADSNGTAEIVAVFVNGNRSHPIIIRADDRRYRVKNLQPGESSLYDDQGQQIYISRAGIKILGGGSDLPVTVQVGSVSLEVSSTGVTVTGNLIVNGGVQISGAITAIGGGIYAGNFETSGDVIAGKGTGSQVGVQTHMHGGVAAGAGSTAAPTPGT